METFTPGARFPGSAVPVPDGATRSGWQSLLGFEHCARGEQRRRICLSAFCFLEPTRIPVCWDCLGTLHPLKKLQSNLDGVADVRRLQLLIDAIVDYAIFMIDIDGTVRSWNSGAERLKGYSASEIIGKSFSSFYLPEDRERGLPKVALKTAAETGRFSSEGWRLRKDGSRFWALVVIDAVRDEQGELIGFAKVTRDITERQQAHEEI